MSTNDLKKLKATISNDKDREFWQETVQFDNDAYGSELNETLANGETDHLEELENTNDLLRENWFDHQSFSPS